jgi:hypothetical protein
MGNFARKGLGILQKNQMETKGILPRPGKRAINVEKVFD